MGLSWKEEFKPANFLPNHNEPEIFIASQWQFDKSAPTILYVMVRTAIFLTFFVIWILTYTMETTAGKPRWPIYLTNWGMTLCVLQSFLSCLMVTCALLGKSVLDRPELTESVLRLYHTYWVIHVMAITVAFSITFVYWTLIYRATGSYWSTMNFMVHGFNSILMFVDFCLVSHPVRILHFVYPICITLAYTIMTAIFYMCGGTTKDGSRYIYPILKWDEPGKTIAYCFGIMVLMGLMHTTTFFLYKAKSKIAQLCFGDDNISTNSMLEQGVQML